VTGNNDGNDEIPTTKSMRLQREIHRLRTSPSLRIGSHITDAMRKPWRAPFLLITIPFLMMKIGFEMLGRSPAPEGPLFPQLSSVTENTIVMFPTNGVGFGHFTRLLALAKRIKKMEPEIEIVFFTTMPTLHILKEAGFPAHHVSGPKYFSGLDSKRWNSLIEEELNLCFDVHHPKMFIFDGAFPYRGMLRSLTSRSATKKVWIRRGTFRQGSNIPVDSIGYFDAIVHPEDSIPLKPSEINHDVETLTCPPIVLLDSNEMLSRDAARKRLMLPLTSRVIYVQLGAGEINDINSEIRLTVEALTKHPDVHIVVGESMIGNRLHIEIERVHIIRDYPNSMYFQAFDATIQAGGYNSFHETRNSSLPTIFFPNMETGMDDQLARCLVAEEEGWGKVLSKRTKESIESAVESLLGHLDYEVPEQRESGAWVLAKKMLNLFEDD